MATGNGAIAVSPPHGGGKTTSLNLSGAIRQLPPTPLLLEGLIMDWAVYHVEGHTTAGCFFSNHFDTMQDALDYWGCAEDWQDGEIVAEYCIDGQRSVEIFWRKGF